MSKSRAIAFGLAAVAGIVLAAWLAAPAQGPPVRRNDHERIVCTSPGVAEIVFAVGAGERVVGVSDYTTYPPEAQSRPRVGGYANPNYERILALRPDLIVAQGEAADLRQFAGDHGIALVSLALTDLESILGEIMRVGRLLGRQGAGDRLVARLRGQLRNVRQSVAGRAPVRALLVMGREQGTLNNIYTVGQGTFLHDLVEVAGGVNVFADLPGDYRMVNKEALVARAPEVVVELKGEGGDRAEVEQEVRRLWQSMDSLPAVQHGRVHAIAATYALIPGPRVVKLADRLAELFHPEAHDG